MPPLTSFLGPFFVSDDPKVQDLSFAKESLSALSSQLPKTLFQSIHCLPDQTYLLPLHWEGYRLQTRFTYRIQYSYTCDLWKQISAKQKSVIRKAETLYSINTIDDFDRFFALNEQTFSRKGMEVPYSRDLFHLLDSGLEIRGQKTILGAFDQEGHLDGAIYLVHDATTVYLLAIGSHNAHRSKGSISLLIWHALQHFAPSHQIFDFEGSMIKGIEAFFRSFGGIPTTYIRLTKTHNKFSDGLLTALGHI